MPGPTTPRSTIDSALYKYTQDQTTHGIFVEGTFDKYVIRHIFARAKKTPPPLYTTDFIDIPSSSLEATGLLNGTKGRLIYLASQADLRGLSNQITCVIDHDGHLDGMRTDSPALACTDYSCSEMYACNEEAFATMLTTAGSDLHGTEGLYSQALDILYKTAVCRFENHKRKLLGSLPPLSRHISMSGRSIVFDSNSYVTDISLSSTSPNAAAILSEALSNPSYFESTDTRSYASGHDYENLVHLLISSLGTVNSSIRRNPQYTNSLMISASANSVSQSTLADTLLTKHFAQA